MFDFRSIAGEPPLDHLELLARVRYSLDEPADAELTDEARQAVGQLLVRLRQCGVKVAPRLLPGLHRTVEEVCGRLLLRARPQVYILPDAELNASAISNGQDAIVTIHSALVQLLDPDELASVLGHELAHLAYRHGEGRLRPPETVSGGLLAMQQQRAAEVSSDRVGLLASADPHSAMRTTLKLACGLGAPHLTPDLDHFVETFAAVPEDIDADWHDASTHPHAAFRIWAMQRFLESDVYASLRGGPSLRPLREVDAEITERMAAIGAGGAFLATADHVHEALAWLGLLAVAEDGQVTEQERAALVDVVGRIWADDAWIYARRHGLRAVRRRAEEALRPLGHGHSSHLARLEQALLELLQRSGAEHRREELLGLVRRVTRPR